MAGLHLPSALDLARSQFAFVVVWHFLYPALLIGVFFLFSAIFVSVAP